MYLPIRIGDVIRAVDTFERCRSFRLLSIRRDEYQVAMERCRRMLYEEDVILEPVLPSSASVLSSTEHGVWTTWPTVWACYTFALLLEAMDDGPRTLGYLNWHDLFKAKSITWRPTDRSRSEGRRR